MAKISIIVPVYNAEKNLKRCINSILAQTNTDFELILVDDGSTDNSGTICDEYAEKDSRIVVIHKDNKGVSAARNTGLEHSAGTYIMFCDSDDTVEETWCENLYDAIVKNPDSWVMCGCSYVNSDTQEIQKQITYAEDDVSLIDKNKYFRIFKLGISGYIWNHIYDSEVLRKHNICFDENTDYAEDALFNNEYLKYCDDICFINLPLYNHYVSNSSGLSNKYFPDFYDKLKPVYLSRKQFIADDLIPEFCYQYFYYFNLSLKNTFDKRNTSSFIKKLKYNNYVINDSAFIDCLDKMKIPKEDKKYVELLKKGNYLLIYIRNKL